VVVNRNFDHEDQYKNISESVRQEMVINKCADYTILSDGQTSHLRDKENKVEVEDPDQLAALEASKANNPFAGGSGSGSASGKGSGSGSGSSADPHGIGGSGPSGLNKYMKAASGVYCFTQLHIILNRRYHDNIGDYAYSGCLDPTAPIINASKPVVTQAAISLAQARVQHVASQFMNEQQSLSPLL
jgi:hypothetical protein